MDAPYDTDTLTDIIIGCAIQSHQKYGPGLLHAVYLLLLAQMLLERNLSVEVEKPVPLCDGGVQLDRAFRADLIVNDRVVVEVKAIKKITDLESVQLLTYLRLLDKRVGLIINSNVPVLKQGIRRVVNRYVKDVKDEGYYEFSSPAAVAGIPPAHSKPAPPPRLDISLW